jgi:putative nucleotidyltransferase with HDIG domain
MASQPLAVEQPVPLFNTPNSVVAVIAHPSLAGLPLEEEFVKRGARYVLLTGHAAVVECVTKRRIDCIILSIADPDLSYADILKNIHARQSDILVVLVSGSNEQTLAFDLISAGLAHHQILLPCQREEFELLVEHIVKTQIELHNYKLRKNLANFSNLPVPQRFQNQLHALLAKPSVSMNQLIFEIEKNPGLVAKILRVANSVHYATRSSIVSLQQAITFIGTDYLETLVTAIDLFENIAVSRRPDIHMLYERLWDSALRRALIAKHIAEKSSLGKDANIVHIAALLQDIGLLARMCMEPDLYMRMVILAHEEHISLYGAELRVFLTTHDEIGAALLNRWNFSHDIIFAIANHHGETFGNEIARIVQIADALDPSGSVEPHEDELLPKIVEWGERLEGVLQTIQNPKEPN